MDNNNNQNQSNNNNNAIPTSSSSFLNHQLIVHTGWLMKSPPEKRIWKTVNKIFLYLLLLSSFCISQKWRRRWFVLKLSGHIPGQYILEYYVDQSCKKIKGSIDLDQCEQVCCAFLIF